MRNRRGYAALAGVLGIVLVAAGLGAWNFGRNLGWWGSSDAVQALWDEPIIKVVKEHFSDRELRYEEPEVSVGIKPTPASIGVKIPLSDEGEKVLDVIKNAAQSERWTPLGTCPEYFQFCATKVSDRGDTLLLTYRTEHFGEADAQKPEGYLEISTN